MTLKDNVDVRLRMTEPLTSRRCSSRTCSASRRRSRSPRTPSSPSTSSCRAASTSGRWSTTRRRSAPSSSPTRASSTSTSRLRHQGAEADPPAGAASLALNRFTVSPQNGNVPAGGGTATLNVKFQAASGNSPENEILVIDVADRDETKESDGVAYELTAESCIPGIETADWINIFEEQTVNRTVVLAAAGLPTNVFAEDEKLFTFGSHMVGREVSERFKLTNPFKVPCTVALEVSPRAPAGAAAAGKDAAGGGEMPFDIEPKKLTIPPHEHRYVTCFFTPQSMQIYYASLEANVELGTDPATKQLTFDLMAEGTLPHVSVVKPSLKTEEGAPLLAFPKLTRRADRAAAAHAAQRGRAAGDRLGLAADRAGALLVRALRAERLAAVDGRADGGRRLQADGRRRVSARASASRCTRTRSRTCPSCSRRRDTCRRWPSRTCRRRPRPPAAPRRGGGRRAANAADGDDDALLWRRRGRRAEGADLHAANFSASRAASSGRRPAASASRPRWAT